jgi:hypothetical protein
MRQLIVPAAPRAPASRHSPNCGPVTRNASTESVSPIGRCPRDACHRKPDYAVNRRPGPRGLGGYGSIEAKAGCYCTDRPEADVNVEFLREEDHR